MSQFKTMTVGRLHKILSKLIEHGEARTPVAIFKDTFSHNLDEVAIHEVCGVNVEPILNCDDDGGIKCNRDGTESYRRTAVLYGAGGTVNDGHVKID